MDSVEFFNASFLAFASGKSIIESFKFNFMLLYVLRAHQTADVKRNCIAVGLFWEMLIFDAFSESSEQGFK